MKIEPAPDVELMARDIIEKLGWDHINIDRVKFVRSKEVKTRAIARIWGLSKIWQKVFGYEPAYVIELVSPRFDRLSREEKEKTIIHELLHIPKNFSGAVVSHKHFGKWKVNGRIVERYWREYKSKADINMSF